MEHITNKALHLTTTCLILEEKLIQNKVTEDVLNINTDSRKDIGFWKFPDQRPLPRFLNLSWKLASNS